MFQLQCLKIIKSQIPHLGKKWKQQNMKIVTAIYLNCRPDLRDEWLTQGMEQDELDASGVRRDLFVSSRLLAFEQTNLRAQRLHRPKSRLSGPSSGTITRNTTRPTSAHTPAARPPTDDPSRTPSGRAWAPPGTTTLRTHLSTTMGVRPHRPPSRTLTSSRRTDRTPQRQATRRTCFRTT